MTFQPYTVYFILFLNFIYTAHFLAVEQIRFANFKMVHSLKDYVTKDSAIWIKSVRSSMFCFVACFEDTVCKSVFYKKLTKDCTGHSVVYNSNEMATFDPGNIYFVNVNPTDSVIDEVTTTLTTTMETTENPTIMETTENPTELCTPVKCPTTYGYTMDADAELCYKIFTDIKVMASAKEFCENSHTTGRLVVPNTDKKMTALRVACQAYSQELQLWLGAERRNDGTLDHWSDGSPIDSGIWNDGEPNNWGGYEGCVTMDGRRGYLVNDEDCNFVLNYICEVPMC